MRRYRSMRAGGWCWVGLTAGVLAADFLLIRSRKATMSEVFGDALRHPRRRWWVLCAWAVLTSHLFGNLMPHFVRRSDPIRVVAKAVAVRVTIPA